MDQQYLDILKQNYQKLQLYCDAFWNSVFEKCAPLMQCHKGCSGCCELQSVLLIEAWVIKSALNAPAKHISGKQNDQCPLLADSECVVYSKRPLICRTHGLILNSSEFSTPLRSCPSTFKDADTARFTPELIFDLDKITNNLVRLNMALCILIDKSELSSERIPLNDIINGCTNPELDLLGEF